MGFADHVGVVGFRRRIMYRPKSCQSIDKYPGQPESPTGSTIIKDNNNKQQ